MPKFEFQPTCFNAVECHSNCGLNAQKIRDYPTFVDIRVLTELRDTKGIKKLCKIKMILSGLRFDPDSLMDMTYNEDGASV